MNLFKYMSLRLNVPKKLNCKKNNISFNCTSKQIYFHSQSKATTPLVSSQQEGKVQWNFKLIELNKCKIDCLLVLNNDHINKNWIKKVLPQTQNILLADGGANIFYSKILQNGQKQLKLVEKVKAVIGDLDSVTDEARRFYKSHGIKLIKQFDQQKNDFEKTLMYGLQLNCKNFIVSGAFGNRLDHSLSTMSITQKYTKNQKDLNIILTNKQSIYCPLRPGLKHKFSISQDIQKSGCGIVTFRKISHIETKGFKWNLGENEKYSSIQWGNFLSTSNQILNDSFQVSFNNDKNEVAYFVARLKKDLE